MILVGFDFSIFFLRVRSYTKLFKEFAGTVRAVRVCLKMGARSQYWHASRESYGNERDFRDSLGYPILAPYFQTNQSGTCLREGGPFFIFPIVGGVEG